jgi:hypothetical protein
MEKLAGRLLVVTVLIIVVAAVYIFNLHNDLAKAQETVAIATQNRDEFRHRLDEVQRSANTSTAALNTCNAQLKDAQTQLDATKKPARRKS